MAYVDVQNVQIVRSTFLWICPAAELGALVNGRLRSTSILSWTEHQTTNLGVRSSNLFGCANVINDLR
jgi:hypothetical protein